jgi:predicted outer membrane repeat protein
MIRKIGCVLVLFPSLCLGATIHVPGDQPTIQQGINAAGIPDMVLVAPGTYVENIDFIGKLITVRSSGGPSVTIIDGNNEGPVVSFVNQEGPLSVIEGFTITNGSALTGGGIFCDEFSAPQIRGNVISYNSATAGGGIYCEKLSSTISGNVILGNSAGSGGGIYTRLGKPVLVNNTIAKNTANTGAGVYCADNAPQLNCNTIAMNASNFEGGGILAIDSELTITNTILWGNTASLGKQIYVMPGGSAAVSYSDVEGGWLGPGNINVWPGFVNVGGDDFHLDLFSSCINKGTNLGTPFKDIDGDPRPFAGLTDIGSDEVVENLPLIADKYALPASVGGTVNFGLNAGVINGGRFYLLLISMSGTDPGTPLPGGYAVLPLNFDWLTNVGLLYINTQTFKQFLGVLNPSGIAWAQLNAKTYIPTSVPFAVTFAYALNNTWNFVSNPVNVVVMP